jgi:plastocyanin
MKKTIGVSLLLLAAGLALAVSVARPAATENTLDAVVGPGFSITLMQNGVRVTHLDPGDYTINVDDKSTEHNFHLFGTGVDQTTQVDAIGTATWHVTFQNGTYTYVCDAHVASMIGHFTVGTVPPTTTAPPTLKAGVKLAALRRALTVTGTASRRATISITLLKGAKKVASKSGTGTKLTLRYTAKSGGKYVARVVAKAAGSSASATKSLRLK